MSLPATNPHSPMGYSSAIKATLPSKKSGKKSGFTLIELLIVVAIIGIITAIAYPSYGRFVKKSRRADGHLALLQEAQTMERCKSTSYSYASCSLQNTTSPEGYYNLTVASDATTFTITATATSAQSGDTGCTSMTLNQMSVRTPSPDSSDCWPD